MEHREPLFEKDPLSLNVPAGTMVTRDHEVIQRWAEIRHAEPATGEATASGPAKIDVNDGGSGIRFNFPGAALFRPVGWDEWFENFDEHQLVFVYQEPLADPQGSKYHIDKLETLTARFPQLRLL
jgi:hypothetical protein